MEKAEKRLVRRKILGLLDTHCDGCTKVLKYTEMPEHNRISWCIGNCQIGRTLNKLGDSLDEGRTGNMGEERNWDQICAKAEQLRANDEKKWTWGKIAEQFGVTEGNLYYHISRRREANKPSVKRVGTSKVKNDTKPLPKPQRAEKTKSEPSKLKSVASSHLEMTASLTDHLKEQLTAMVDEKDALRKELGEVSQQYSELKDLKEKLAQDFIAETKARLEAEDAFERIQKQLQDRDEDHATLLNEFNLLNEKKWELENQLRKAHENMRLSEEIAHKEREHRIELQGKSQALGMALKAVL